MSVAKKILIFSNVPAQTVIILARYLTHNLVTAIEMFTKSIALCLNDTLKDDDYEEDYLNDQTKYIDLETPPLPIEADISSIGNQFF